MKLIAVFALAVLIAQSCYASEKNPSQAPKKNPIPIVVSAATIRAEYQANEIRADKEFKGKVLTVSGVLKSVEKGFFGNLYINFEEGIRATFSENMADRLSKLNPGDHIDMTCLGDGTILGEPMLDCTGMQ